MANGMHTETLKPPEEEVIVKYPSMLSVVEDLFKNELSGHKWKSLTFGQVSDLIKKKTEDHGVSFGDRHYILLQRKLRECTTVDKFVLSLGEFFLGKGL